MTEEIKGISIDDQKKGLIESFGINTEELNDKFKKFITNELSESIEESEGRSSLELNPVKAAKSYLKTFTLQEIAAMAATGMFEKLDSFVRSLLEFASQSEEDEEEIDFNMTIS